MSEATYCWFCNGKLSTHGGLHFAEVKTPNGPVRVHKVCRINAIEMMRKLTAQPPPQRVDIIGDDR